MEGDAGGVRDVAEEDVFERRVRRRKYLRHKRSAERLAFAVDVGVVCAREVDALENAWAGCNIDCRIQFCHLDFAGGRNDKRLAGRKLFHGFGRHVERRLDRGTLARDGHHLVADVIPAWPDAVRIARGERPAVAGRAADRPCAIGVGECLGECVGERFAAAQLVRDQFADQVAVGLAGRERAMIGIVVEELVGVREIEVPRKQERMLQLARLMHERMAERRVVPPERGVAQMPEENPLVCRLRPFADAAKHIRERCCGGGLCDPAWRRPWLRRGAQDSRACAVLAPVVLLLKEQRELRSPEIAASGRWRPPHDHHRHSALVFQFIGHHLDQ